MSARKLEHRAFTVRITAKPFFIIQISNGANIAFYYLYSFRALFEKYQVELDNIPCSQ